MRRSMLALLTLLGAAAVPAAGARSAEFVLTISGTDGTPFAAEVLLAGHGPTRSEQLSGTVPVRLERAGDGIRLDLRKLTASGRLEVRLYRDGKPVGQGMAAGTGGTVTVSAGDLGATAADWHRYRKRYQ